MSKNKIFRVSSYAYHVGNQEYKLPETPDSEYVIDDSSFVPIKEAIKQLGKGYGEGNHIEQMYDFPDGKDTGAQIPFSRSSQFKDIAELSTEINNSQTEIQNKLDEAKKEQEFRDKISKDLGSTTPAETSSS